MAENRVLQVYQDPQIASIRGGASKIVLELRYKRIGIHPLYNSS